MRFRTLVLGLLTAGLVWGQRLETAIFYADMSTANEVPPVTGVNASGSATIAVHATRNAAGAVEFAVVDFEVNFTHADATNFTGLHIHNAPAGQNAGVVIGTNLSAANPVEHPGGAGRIFRQVTVTDAALIGRLLAQPDQFYVNLHSREFGGGVIRAQLARAEVLQLRAPMSPLNEVPAITDLEASAAAAITAVAVRDGSGQITGGEVRFDINHYFVLPANFTGLHIHNGPAGVNAGVVIGTDLSAANPIANQTTGRIIRWVPIRTAAQLTALRGLFTNPAGYYANLHTTVHGGGAARGQLLNTGSITLQLPMTTDQEVPPTNIQASARANVHIHPTRGQNGRVTSATVIFDVNHVFPDATEFTGLHIHRQVAGQNGGVVIDSGISGSASVTNPGTGNITRLINIDASNTNALNAVNDLLANPSGFYLNLHTRQFGAGAVRGQLGQPAAAPAVNANGIINAVQDAAIAPASPGSIISIYGTNLAGTTSDASGVELPLLPTSLNGTDVRIAGRQAAAFFVSPNQINVQVPYETEPGDVQVFVVRGGDAFSAPYTLRVTPHSPGIFVTPAGAAVLKNADFSLVSASNPAAAGEVLSIFCTGLGAVTPRVPSGGLAPSGPIALTVTQPTVTVGGRDAEVLGAALAPGFVGLYQVAIRMPQGVASGNQPVVVTIGGVTSNRPTIAVR
jgi:uncharacterized protein (TIGR03437 family)